MKRVCWLFFVLFATVDLKAQLAVALADLDASENRALVELEVTNGLAAPVRNARLMILLMDDQGKVVGSHAQWMSGSTSPEVSGSDVAVAPAASLEAGAKLSLPIKVVTTAKAAKSQVICSRIVMGDGTLADPRTEFKFTE